MDLYLEDGLIPGLEDGIVSDSVSDPMTMFEEEMAGFSDHLADAVRQDTSPDPPVFIEKMGCLILKVIVFPAINS